MNQFVNLNYARSSRVGLTMIELIVGAALALIFYLLGVQVGKRQVKPPKPRKLEIYETRCGCDHQLSYHDLENGKCKALFTKEYYNEDMQQDMLKYIDCPCQSYTGLLPPDRIVMSRI